MSYSRTVSLPVAAEEAFALVTRAGATAPLADRHGPRRPARRR